MAGIVVTPFPDQGRMSVDVTMAATVQKIVVKRQDPIGAAPIIRYGDQIPTPGGHVVIDDYEAPLDVPVYYIATQAVPTGTETYQSTPKTLLSNGYSWLKDPGFPSMNVRVEVMTSIASIAMAQRTGLFSIIDRPYPVVVTSVRSGATGTAVLHTLTDADRINLRDLLARGSTLLLQTPNAYGFGSQYISIGDTEEARVGLAMEPARMWTLPFTVVERPEGLYTQPVIAATWADVKAKYATWKDLKNSGKTWQRLLEEGA